jgi:glycosyltransferase involved in cell wall biosynthesis/SAM-dependent methyltransferase
LVAGRKRRVLIFIVAYEAERTIAHVLRRIPAELADTYDIECLIIDDCSRDGTFEEGRAVRDLPFPLTVLYNPVNQGYGGNQKIGYHYAIRNGFDFVALLHGDGQYAPECLPELLEPLRNGEADAVFGSRMLARGAARSGGMPLYKFAGNKILTWIENRALRTRLSEFHSGYRIYSVATLQTIPFDLNTNDFHFDTEIIVQLTIAKARIVEAPIPTYYGDEICRVNGIKYAWNVVRAVLKSRLQEAGIFYDRKYDCAPGPPGNSHYLLKLDFESPHTLTLAKVATGASVLDLGCAGGYLDSLLRSRRGCRVTGVDAFALTDPSCVDEFVPHDLNQGWPDIDLRRFDYVLLLDVIEHLASPERFVDELRRAAELCPNVRIIVSSGNVAFFVVRLMLLLGQFNYGKRGILDATHTRLFTFGSLRRLFEQGGFRVLEERGIPGPFPLALGEGLLSRALLALNRACIRISRSLFSYQMYMILEPRPSLELLLRRADEHSKSRVNSAMGQK